MYIDPTNLFFQYILDISYIILVLEINLFEFGQIWLNFQKYYNKADFRLPSS